MGCITKLGLWVLSFAGLGCCLLLGYVLLIRQAPSTSLTGRVSVSLTLPSDGGAQRAALRLLGAQRELLWTLRRGAGWTLSKGELRACHTPCPSLTDGW